MEEVIYHLQKFHFRDQGDSIVGPWYIQNALLVETKKLTNIDKKTTKDHQEFYFKKTCKLIY